MTPILGRPILGVMLLALSGSAAACGTPADEPGGTGDAPLPPIDGLDLDGQAPDAVPPDGRDAPDGGGVDAPVADAPAVGPVQVQVVSLLGTGAPDPGATVYFAHPDGSFIGQAATDAAGVANGMVSPGGSVTVHHGGAGAATWSTVVGVQVGDVLRFGQETRVGRDRMTFELPATDVLEGYSVSTRCGSGSSATSTVEVELIAGCTTKGAILAQAYRGSVPPLHFVVTELELQRDTVVDLAGSWKELADASAVLGGVPAEATDLRVVGTELSGGQPLFMHNATLAPGAPPTATWAGPVGLDGVRVEAYFQRGASEGYTVTRFQSPPPPSPIPIDATPRLPEIDDLFHDASGVRWVTSGNAPFDTIRVTTQDGPVTWTFVVPPTTDRLIYPHLPGAPAPVLTQVMLTDVDGAATYDDLRPRAGFNTAVPAEVPRPEPADFTIHTATYLAP